MIKGNLIVGQSGGPTAVINSSLAGVYKTAKDKGVKKVYGMVNGIKGLLEERVVDISDHIKNDLDIELLKRTPSSFLGSCRFKLPEIESNEAMYEKIFAILKKLEIEYFLYIGGNDSMDTIQKLHKYGNSINSSIKFMGVPKTIDNDLSITDHTPGFGSAAKFIGSTFKELIRDSLVYGNNQVTVVEIMGRNTGWLTAAASLAKSEDCEGPNMILLPETNFNMDVFLDKMDKLQKKRRAIVIAVSEGLIMEDGRYVCELNNTIKTQDSFGHTSLGGTAYVLSELVARKFHCKSRPIELSTLQRCASHMTSRVDITEAFQAGGQAVNAAFAGQSGEVIIFVRLSSDPYAITTDSVSVDRIANIEKKVPLEWITHDATNVSKELTDYMRPLIQGELSPIIVDGLPRHLLLSI